MFNTVFITLTPDQLKVGDIVTKGWSTDKFSYAVESITVTKLATVTIYDVEIGWVNPFPNRWFTSPTRLSRRTHYLINGEFGSRDFYIRV